MNLDKKDITVEIEITTIKPTSEYISNRSKFQECKYKRDKCKHSQAGDIYSDSGWCLIYTRMDYFYPSDSASQSLKPRDPNYTLVYHQDKSRNSQQSLYPGLPKPYTLG